MEDGWLDVPSETLLEDTIQPLEQENHLVMSEYSIVGFLAYTSSERRKERRIVAFASNNQTSEELSVRYKPLQQCGEVTTILQPVRQGHLFQMTTFYDGTLPVEEGNK